MTNELTIYKNKNKAIVPYEKKKKLKKINNETLLILSLVYVYVYLYFLYQMFTCRDIFIKKNLKILVKRIPVGTAVVTWGMLSIRSEEHHTIVARKHNSDWELDLVNWEMLSIRSEEHHTIVARKHNSDWWGGAQGNWEFEDRVQEGVNWHLFVMELWRDNRVHFTKFSINSEIYTKERKIRALMGHGYDGPYIEWPKPDYLIPGMKRADWESWFTLEEALKVERTRLALKELLPDFFDDILMGAARGTLLGEYKEWLTKAYTRLQPDELSIALREAALSKLQEATFLETVPSLKVVEMLSKACPDPVLLTLLGGAAAAAGALWGQGPGLSKDSWEAGLKTLVKVIGENNKRSTPLSKSAQMWSYVCSEIKHAWKNPREFGLKMLIKVLGYDNKLLCYTWPEIKGIREKHWQYTLTKLWSSADANYLKILKFQENTYEDFKMLKELKRLMSSNRINAYSILAKPIKFKSLSYYKNMGNLDTVKAVVNTAKVASDILNEIKLENKQNHEEDQKNKKKFVERLVAVLKVLTNLLNK